MAGASDVLTLAGDVVNGGGLADHVPGGVTAVSCASARACVAVGASGDAVRWNGATWSAPVMVDRDGGGLTGVSCPRSGACTAVDFVGRQLRLAA